MRKTVDPDCELIATDEHAGYQGLNKHLPHGVVCHNQGEYVRGTIHTNSIDGFWSLIKRGIMGSYHHVSTFYLPLYLNEFAFRNNYRKHDDMFSLVIAGS